MSEVEITPRCLKGEAIFVSNDGWLLPCCYVHIYLRRAMALPDKFTTMTTGSPGTATSST